MKIRMHSTELQYSLAAVLLTVCLIVAFTVVAGATVYHYTHQSKTAATPKSTPVVSETKTASSKTTSSQNSSELSQNTQAVQSQPTTSTSPNSEDQRASEDHKTPAVKRTAKDTKKVLDDTLDTVNDVTNTTVKSVTPLGSLKNLLLSL
jgi:cytoskeletal protein RodZ